MSDRHTHPSKNESRRADSAAPHSHDGTAGSRGTGGGLEHGQDHAHEHGHGHEHDADGHDHSKGVSKSQVWLVAVSEAAIALGFLFKWTLPEPAWLSLSAFAVGTLAGGWLVFPGALRSLRRLRLDMNVLMTVAVAGAWIMGEVAEGATVVFLFALAELLESWSVGRARNAIRSLLSLTPETARRLSPGGGSQEVPSAEIQPGERILVHSGERLPLDGEIVKGRSAIDQAPITGESVPVDKVPGDKVFAGTINGEGALEIRVTRPADDSTLARIIRQVESASAGKAPTQRFVDRFAGIYTPAVFLLALLVALLPPLMWGVPWGEWVYRSLALLVIACPCALVIATPVSIVAGLTCLARRGVLVKGGAFLEELGKLRAIALDKTGTVTRGRPKLLAVHRWGRHSEQEILRAAAAIDTFSTHPIAKAVVAAAWSRRVEFAPAIDYKSRTGRGAEAVIDGVPHFIGNHRMAHALGLCTPALEQLLGTIEHRGQSLAIVGRLPHAGQAGEVFGVLGIGDSLRPEVPGVLRRLHDIGLKRLTMLSGDNQRTVDAIAKSAGIDEALGDLLPNQKVEAVEDLRSKYKHVAMIGDGVNDAPAIAAANVGIAMGAAGSDTAIETADVALMNDNLWNLPDAILIGRRTLGIIRFNVAFAVAVKVLFLLLAFTGHTSLWLAILADTGATLLVIANALRLLRFRTPLVDTAQAPK